MVSTKTVLSAKHLKTAAIGAALACLAMTAVGFSSAAFAQNTDGASSTSGTTQPTRRQVWHADHKLEHNVRVALDHAKVNTTDIRIRAKGSKIALDGTVPDQNMIATAGAVAGKVQGVSAVENLVTFREEGN
jgi:hyperosmotically inducible periplasmic protein